MAPRRLPFELQTLLWHFPSYRLVPTAVSPTPSSVLWSRYSSAPAVDASLARFQSSSHVVSHPSPLAVDDITATGPAIFEDVSNEYQGIPLSTLDFPRSAPRSNDDALLALLEAGDLVGARSLRNDLLESSQLIPPRFEFGKYAEQILRADIAGTETTNDWLDWWSLAPSLVSARSMMGQHPGQYKRRVREMAHSAERTLDILMSGRRGRQATTTDWDRVSAFGLVLAEQGFVRGLADKVLIQAAAYAPVDQSEMMWSSSVDSLRRVYHDIGSLVDSPQNASTSSPSARTDAYIASRVQQDFIALRERRAGMLRAHCNLGRLDLFTGLLDELALVEDLDGRPMSLPNESFIPLLAETATSNRFDLFERILANLYRKGRRLVPVHSERLRARTPYHIRGAASASSSGTKSTISPQEAFTTYRYSTHVGALEEGTDEVAQSSLRSDLKAALQVNDADRAAHVITSMMGAHEQPSIDAMADFIRLALDTRQERTLAFVETLDEHFNVRSSKGAHRRSSEMWVVSKMLAFVQRGEHTRALDLFRRTFSLDGIPSTLEQVLATTIPPLDPDSRSGQTPLTAGALRIACEALVALLEKSQKTQIISMIYETLLREPAIIIPLRPKGLSSPLDASTFTPFILSFSKREDPLVLLKVLDQMWTLLRLRPTKHQIGMMLGSFARFARSNELFYVLDIVTRRPTAGLQGSVREQVVEMMHNIEEAFDEEKNRLDIVVWSAMIEGLMRQKDHQAAQEVVRRMQQSPGFGKGWFEDQRLREAMTKLLKSTRSVEE
ncbi:BQ5605_C005g03330 [Microbotryum silenes-dioicae]|uniref:BQ5605_C005g03330 protein n=1 Tax=Microbotryum silenes-dioicae TaxID=796604 RepID=A0A2X0MF09_9BASI|nr:BQ5605_C005g03330 [Microbotryum silenes-dioicae]